MARWAARKALEFDDSSAEAHVWLANIKSHYDWDWAGAEAEFKRATEVQPKSGMAREGYAMFLASRGRSAEARAEMKRSEPLLQLTPRVCYNYGLVLYFDRQYDQAIAHGLKGLALETNSVLNHALLMNCYVMKELYPEAITEGQKLRSLDDSPNVGAKLGYIYAAAGQPTRRAKYFRNSNAMPQHDMCRLISWASFTSGSARREKALNVGANLRRAFRLDD